LRNGDSWRSDVLAVEAGSSSFTGAMEKVIARYPAGSTVTVYYNPDAPHDAMLEPGKMSWWAIFGGFALPPVALPPWSTTFSHGCAIDQARAIPRSSVTLFAISSGSPSDQISPDRHSYLDRVRRRIMFLRDLERNRPSMRMGIMGSFKLRRQ